GHDEDVVVAVPVGGERDVLAVRREARVDVAGAVDGEALRAGAVFVDEPNVAEIAEDDFAVMVVGVPGETDLAGGGERRAQAGGEGCHQGFPTHNCSPCPKDGDWYPCWGFS